MIDERNFFDQLVRNHIKTYKSINKITTGQEDNYTSGCRRDYPHFRENYKLTSIDLS